MPHWRYPCNLTLKSNPTLKFKKQNNDGTPWPFKKQWQYMQDVARCIPHVSLLWIKTDHHWLSLLSEATQIVPQALAGYP